MTTLSGHSSASYPAQGEMVGLGARRKITGIHQPRMALSEESHEHQTNVTVTTLNLPLPCLSSASPRNGFNRRERRHVYHDILPLKSEVEKAQSKYNPTNSNKEQLDATSDKLCLNDTPGSSKCVREKPEIPPKPKYILRDKRLRHVYQTIDLPVNSKKDGIPLPPLPNVPAHMQHVSVSEEEPPPLPPRRANPEAIRQRQKLDQEYFENLRKSVDGELLDLVEEGDLPVSAPRTEPVSESQQRNYNYGAHSPPLNIPGAVARNFHVHQQPETPSRRHSLPIYESITDDDAARSPPPMLPVRANSHDFDSEENSVFPIPRTPRGSQSEVNLAENLLLLKTCGWYWGNMTWQEAEKLLLQTEGEGVFLMRDSQNPLHLLTITVRSTTNTVHHVRVEYSEGKFQLYEPGRTVSRSTAQCVRHSNIKQFINLAIKHSKSGSFLYFLKPKNMGEPPVQIRFITPISRLSKVKSLKYLCRMAIRNCVVADLIPSISLPPSIQLYLVSGPYYDPKEDL